MAEETKKYRSTLEEVIEFLEDTKAEYPDQKSKQIVFDLLKGHFEAILRAPKKGEPLAYVGIFHPIELFLAMDITYFFPEMHFFFAFPEGMDCYEFYDVAEGMGVSKETCSPHRVHIGMAKKGLLPKPDFIVSSANSCDQTLKSYEILAQMFNCPTHLFDASFGSTPRDVEYARCETEELIEFLEKQTGKKFDLERLREVLKFSKEAHDLWFELGQMRKHIPSPDTTIDNLWDYTVILYAGGTPQAVDYFRARHEEARAKIERGEGAAPEEKLRIAWLYALPYHDLGIMDWMVEEFGAVPVVDSFSYISQDIQLNFDDPMDYLIKAPYKYGFVRRTYDLMEISKMAEEYAQMCLDYQVDGVLCFAHWSCRQYCATIKRVKDEIQQVTKLPFMVIEGDIVDPRTVTSTQMRARLREFFSYLKPRPKTTG